MISNVTILGNNMSVNDNYNNYWDGYGYENMDKYRNRNYTIVLYQEHLPFRRLRPVLVPIITIYSD